MKQPPLAKLLGGEPDEPSVQRMWGEISGRLDKPRAGARWFIIAPVSLLACAAILFAVFSRGSDNPVPHQELTVASGQPIEYMAHGLSAGAPRTIALSDGSDLQLEPGTELRTVVNTKEALTLNLERGASTFQVAKVAGRTWTVRCAGVEVVVTGTKFRVARDESSVAVQVYEGSVRVLDTHGRLRELGVGDSLRVSTSLEIAANAQPPEPVGNPDLELVDPDEDSAPQKTTTPDKSTTPDNDTTSNKGTARGKDTTPNKDTSPPQNTTKRALVRALRSGDGTKALALLAPDKNTSLRLRSLSAADLMTLADLARGENQPRVAVAPLQALIKGHPRDRLAPLAAFTLGKLWLVELRNSKRAAGAFEKAIALGLPKSLREQAFARRVEAYARSANSEAFDRTSKLYKESFPTGKLLKKSHRWLAK